MENIIKIDNGPEGLAKGKRELSDTLRAAWASMQQDHSELSPIITVTFGNRESWLRLRSDAGKPFLCYADNHHLAILFPLKEAASQFLDEASRATRKSAPFVLKKYFLDIDEERRLEKSFNQELSYLPDPRHRLEDLELLKTAQEKAPGRFSVFHHESDEVGETDATPEVTQKLRGKN
jgi:hypothetical protein